jgi:hypothetical protein
MDIIVILNSMLYVVIKSNISTIIIELPLPTVYIGAAASVIAHLNEPLHV